MTYTYEYPRPAVTVDALIFGYDAYSATIQLLLIQRANEPFKDHWALPGGFLDMGEDLITAAQRELEEETGLKNIQLHQLKTYGQPDRDPRGRTITVTYFAIVPLQENHAIAADDAKAVRWLKVLQHPENVQSLPPQLPLAFDHEMVLRDAVFHLKRMPYLQPIGKGVLKDSFHPSELLKFYETILEKKIDEKTFSEKVINNSFIKKRLDSKSLENIYEFDSEEYEQLLSKGCIFDL